MASTDQIRYDLLAQDALRGVVRRVLMDVARDGLPGEHHFFISFDTRVPGVRLSTRMREKYPEDMTIVLQHQFWDLLVTENGFEVGLSFGGVPERLLVPFAALKGFFDPSVKFGLQFELVDEAATQPADTAGSNVEPLAPPAAVPAPAPVARPVVRGAASEPSLASGTSKLDVTPDVPAKTEAQETERPSGGAEVVRLDVFRKK